MNVIIQGNAESFLSLIPDGSIDLIYIDPPFNTGKKQKRVQMCTERSETGDRRGFGGFTYKTLESAICYGYEDVFDDYEKFITPFFLESWRVLKSTGSFYVHLDWHEVHYCKVFLDRIFGRDNFINEIIWAYDYGAKSKRKFPTKHDNILFYAKDHKQYVFNSDEIDREPYMSPGLVTPEKAARGKLPTDVWWHTIVATNSKEKTGYPTQKPVALLKRIVTASSKPGDLVLDFFAGSGTTGDAARQLGRKYILVDNNPDAIDVMNTRIGDDNVCILRQGQEDDARTILSMVT